MQRGALLSPELDNAAMFPGGLDHLAAFFDGNGSGLFDVHVLAGLTGHNGLQGMPMVRGAYDQYINILAVQ